MKKLRKLKATTLLLLFCILLQAPVFVFAQTTQTAPVPATTTTAANDINARIRKEGMDNSQAMRTVHFFTDVYGPRLTGSPNLKAAGEWAVRQMREWGFDNAQMVPWNFGSPGWVNERASGFITAPVQDSLVFEVLAWTPGTNGTVRGDAFLLTLPERPTQEELTNYFNSIRDSVKGKMVLIGAPGRIPVSFTPTPKRFEDAAIKNRFDPNASPTPSPSPTPAPSPTPSPRPGQLRFGQIIEQLDRFLIESGVAVRINDARREHGQIRAFDNDTYDVTKAVPTVVMRNEDYGRIYRLMQGGSTVSLEFDIRNRTIPEGATSYNVIGEIAGTDKKDEVIMLGGHLDSWHAATGATDNAAGCAIMMEAARILKAIGVKPRRTIRVALWSGEEQGLLGSQAYVKETFGSFEAPKPGYEKFGGYFNVDTGTGRIRGMTVFGPPEGATVLREILAPFADYGVVGALSTKNRGLGGSDHTSFNQAGLPGIGVTQDPIEYFTHTWHTNLDTYERIIEDDVKKAAIVIAASVYALAMRDEMLPRFKAADMPKAPTPLPTPTPAPVTSPTPAASPRP
ncbi:MAG: M20/M25/M40 family metallo-hydrolase [Acidobacteriota bacterium]|nr:M20/M25/M40 family metallo-hydrolase [Acidobacteriota bacterium]